VKKLELFFNNNFSLLQIRYDTMKFST
jgi:hypothetical protein